MWLWRQKQFLNVLSASQGPRNACGVCANPSQKPEEQRAAKGTSPMARVDQCPNSGKQAENKIVISCLSPFLFFLGPY